MPSGLEILRMDRARGFFMIGGTLPLTRHPFWFTDCRDSFSSCYSLLWTRGGDEKDRVPDFA